jgi:galactokinase
MTAVGKILVFFNLIFSLIVGAFVVTVYISQAHWASAYKDLSERNQVVEASVAQYQNDAKKTADYDDLKAKLQAVTATVKAAQADALAQKADADKARADLTAAESKYAANDAALVTALEDVKKRQAESEATKDLLKKQTDDNLKMVQKLGEEHDQMVAWKIRADSAELRSKELEKENDKLARDNQKLIANGGQVVQATKRDGPNPPLDGVEGLIKEVDPSGLVRITIGSDAGLANGNTLEVYRLNTQVPEQSRYLGRIKIIRVSNNEAVGQLMNKSPVPLQPGDTVSSRISSGG